ncbi:SusC/RagA family TonB-linked outer membrane protein [Niastella vici]|uniref:SusC/RagA family TonB-linked outer membrane protein n=2 Tax=Niastella vici TaxID=1703345 RepID=A0A1V9FIK4_9BACT|nr:SusC/RagA family TonB-linked outer membrane protein [Niastella vici]
MKRATGLLCLFFTFCFLPCTASAQPKTAVIKGIVVDETGIPIDGASIVVKGTKTGTSSDARGEFSLNITEGKTVTLVISYTGRETTEVLANTPQKDPLIVMLKVKADAQEEMVVIARGVQKRKEVVGAVTSIKPGELKIPASNLTNALAGRLAGIIAYQRSGEPGADNANFFVRGVTTFGYRKSPLILIDNIEATATDLARLQVDDIASFSIMKDATATALYGSKGANGVIAIVTKEGKDGKVVVSLRAENSLSRSTRNVQLADPITYMELANEAVLTRNPLGGLYYSKEKINNTKRGIDPVIYPVTDWQNMVLRKSAMNQRFNLSLSGGGKVARYYVSGALNVDNGILKVDKRSNFNSNAKLRSYSIRSNVNINLTPTTEMVTRLSGSFDDYMGPINGGAAIYGLIMQSSPVMFPAYYEPTDETRYVKHIMFGNSPEGNFNNPYAQLQRGYKQFNRSNINAQVALYQKLPFILKGLSARGIINIQRNAYFDVTRAYNPFYYIATNYDYGSKHYDLKSINLEDGQSQAAQGTEYLDYKPGEKTAASDFYSEVALDYKGFFKKGHTLSGTLVGIAKGSLNGNSGDLQSSLPFRNAGLSGRVSYVYDGRYAVEFNFGYNGSERFYKTHRYGFFPSAGVAYTISNEKYWDKFSDVVSTLKLRATLGYVGNDAIGSPDDRFFYLSNVNMNSGNRGMRFGTLKDYSLSGIEITRYANNDITWEKALKANLGIEATFFRNLNMVLDVYKERRTNILMTRSSIPTTMGLSATLMANVGEAVSKGVDLSLDYSCNLTSKWWAKGMANFTYATGKFDVYEEPKYPGTNKSHTGRSINQQWGYIAERLFVDEYDARNAPLQSFGSYGAGDIKYRDVNGDGKITELDQVPIGFPTSPEIVYGFGLSTGIRRFDVSVFFQGLARESFWIDVNATTPFVDKQRQLLKVWADNHWSEENRNIYAVWPRLSPDVSGNNSQTSTWFMRNGALLRLKSVEMGYSLNDRPMKRIHVRGARLYLNAANLFTFSRFNLWDVEMGGNGLGYPIQRILNVGINVSF